MIDDTQAIRVSEKQPSKVVFSDTDTLSSFLWRNAFGYFLKLFDKMEIGIIIPRMVLEELEYSSRTKEHLARPVKEFAKRGKIKIEDINAASKEYRTYCYLTEVEDMGRGEAAALSMATHCNVTASVASNNLTDIKSYAERNGIEIWTTARIIRECELEGIISRTRATELWKKMLEDGLKLPFKSYIEYLDNLRVEK